MSSVTNNGVYFSESGHDEQKYCSIVKRLQVHESKTAEEKAKGIWGYVTFYDSMAKRPRTIESRGPIDPSQEEIRFQSNIGDRYVFKYITKAFWGSDVKEWAKLPSTITDIIESTETTENLQNFLYQYPF